MHEEVLTTKQKNLLSLIAKFSDNFMLIGGTAIALHLGHRRSIDFDLITFGNLDHDEILRKIRKNYSIDKTVVDETNELSLIVNSIKITFLKYPFKIKGKVPYKKIIKMPGIRSLAATKAHTLGRRAKWKDYVDLYFIFQKYSLKEVVDKTDEIFGNEFNEKQFREQLSYFDDLDYSEKVDFLKGREVNDDKIKKALTEISLQKY